MFDKLVLKSYLSKTLYCRDRSDASDAFPSAGFRLQKVLQRYVVRQGIIGILKPKNKSAAMVRAIYYE